MASLCGQTHAFDLRLLTDTATCFTVVGASAHTASKRSSSSLESISKFQCCRSASRLRLTNSTTFFLIGPGKVPRTYGGSVRRTDTASVRPSVVIFSPSTTLILGPCCASVPANSPAETQMTAPRTPVVLERRFDIASSWKRATTRLADSSDIP